MSINNTNTNKTTFNEEIEDIDLKKVFNFLFRNKTRIGLTTFIFTFLAIIFSFSQRSVWRGNFKILVDKKDNNTMQDISTLRRVLPVSLSKNAYLDNKLTQENILKSPYVLDSVYEKYLQKIEKKKNKKISFGSWKKNLKIKFIKDTKILNVEFKHHDKELILSTLDDISNEYKKYSKEDKIKKIKKSIAFLESQKIKLNEKSSKSLKDFNQFSIKNRLGDIDGFVDLESNDLGISDSDILQNLTSDITLQNQLGLTSRFDSSSSIPPSGAGLRFRKQLALLETYETQLLDLSTKLKPNSKILLDLNKKIEILSKKLKRPNEILIEYRDKKRAAERDMKLLKEVETKLELSKFEQSKKEDPWQVISNPKIEKSRIYPKKSQFAIIAFLFSFLGSSIYSFFLEKKLGKLYEFDEIDNLLIFEYSDELFCDSQKLNILIIKKILKQKKVDCNLDKICFFTTSAKSNEKLTLKSYFNDDLKIFNLDLDKEINLENFKFIFILINPNITTKRDLITLNNYLEENKNKISWLLINEKKLS